MQGILSSDSCVFNVIRAYARLTNYIHIFRKALLLYRLDRREEAIESVILSIAGYPWNWSAWVLLGNCVEDSEEVVRHPFINNCIK
jgi:hypothetical protein